MAAKNTCEIVEGRLLEIDIAAGFDQPSDIDDQIKLVVSALGKVGPDTKVVIAADWRPCKLFTPETAERAIKLFSDLNARIERSGILHRFDQPTSVLQVLTSVGSAARAVTRIPFPAGARSATRAMVDSSSRRIPSPPRPSAGAIRVSTTLVTWR